MPFVLRKVEPRYLCRGHVPAGSAPQGWPVGAELEAVANGALTTTLKQLASLLTTAEDIFAELTAELTAVADRSSRLRQRIDKVEERLAAVDPKKVPVREYHSVHLRYRAFPPDLIGATADKLPVVNGKLGRSVREEVLATKASRNPKCRARNRWSRAADRRTVATSRFTQWQGACLPRVTEQGMFCFEFWAGYVDPFAVMSDGVER